MSELNILTIDELVRDSAKELRKKLDNVPETAIICGTGMGNVTKKLLEQEYSKKIDFSEIENVPLLTVEGHEGYFVSNGTVLAQSGRKHYYETIDEKGNDIADKKSVRFLNTIYNTLMFAKLGVKNLIITDASGSLYSKEEEITVITGETKAGVTKETDLVVISDTVSDNFPDLAEYYSEGFLDLRSVIAGDELNSIIYSKDMRDLAKSVAEKISLDYESDKDSDEPKMHFDGTFVLVTGPSFETSAHIVKLRNISYKGNADKRDYMPPDVVGMAGVPEAMHAHIKGMKVLHIALVTDIQALGEKRGEVTHQGVQEIGEKTAPFLEEFLHQFVGNFHDKNKEIKVFDPSEHGLFMYK